MSGFGSCLDRDFLVFIIQLHLETSKIIKTIDYSSALNFIKPVSCFVKIAIEFDLTNLPGLPLPTLEFKLPTSQAY